uniref:TIMELESS-interacting protein n=1 Tax=Acrobeloides nanus TaxID=290746 RepID=A0A914EC44_9BILA
MDYDTNEYDDDDMLGDEAIEDENAAEENEENDNDEKALEAVIKKTEDLAKKKRQAASGKLRPKLTERELMDEKKGLEALKELFAGYKPTSKNPYDNLKDVMKKVEYWGHNLFPQSNFDDLITRVEQVGKKRAIKFYMVKLRLGMPTTEEIVPDEDKVDENNENISPAKNETAISDEDDDFYNDDINFVGIEAPQISTTSKTVSSTQKTNVINSDDEMSVSPTVPDEPTEEIVHKKRTDLSSRRIILSDSEDEGDSVAGFSASDANTQPNLTQDIDLMNEDEIMNYLFSTD